jgi:predicted RNA-binding protein YlxR (DUF448 family)
LRATENSEVDADVEALVEIEADRGRQCINTITERLCIATRKLQPVSQMIRFVAGPDGVVVPDLKRKLPGRGVWVTARHDIVAQAVRRGAFGRALKGNFRAAADLPDLLDRLLEASALDALSMARKASLVITGYAQVEASRAAPVALLRARDAGQEAGRKLAAALRHGGKAGERNEAEIIETFTSAQLDLALGRLNVVHAALMAGRPSRTFLGRWRILEFFRADAMDAFGKSTDENAPMTMLQNQDRND